MNARATTRVAAAVLLACLCGSVVLLRQVDRLRPHSTVDESLYFASPRMIKRMSLGYDGLLSDIYWTRAVQYFGSKHHEGATDYRLLAPLLEITTTLDPHLVVAYQFGSNFLAPQPPSGAGMPQKAIDLVNFGIQNNPDEWRLYYELGFIHYMELNDYPGAADAFLRGSKVKDAHPFMKLLAARMAEHAGDLETARMMWTTTYGTTQDQNIRSNAAAHLRALQVDEDVALLENLVARYRQATGRLPASFAELIAARMLTATPIDPVGHPYRLMADGRVEVRTPEELPFIMRGLPPGYKAPLQPKLD